MTLNRNGVGQGAIPKRLVTTKGDIIGTTANAIPARLAVGSDGDTIVADSSTSTGLRYQGNFAAGKNKIINGDFGISQRGTSFVLAASGYSLDRFSYAVATAVPTGTITQQTFTPGAAPVAGYEGSNFARVNITANAGCTILEFEHKVEDVRVFAGQTATFSFYAKADGASTLGQTFVTQNFGSGGSGSVTTNVTLNSTSLTTGFLRYTGTVSVPSITGKTIGTSSFLRVFVRIPAAAGVVRNGTYDFWGWQLEAGSVATAFQTATGTIQGELAACQRYFYKTFSQATTPAQNAGTTGCIQVPQVVTGAVSQSVTSIRFPVTMRATPTVTIFNPSAANAQFRNVNGSVDWAASAVEATGDSGVSFQGTGNASSNSGNRCAFHITADIEL